MLNRESLTESEGIMKHTLTLCASLVASSPSLPADPPPDGGAGPAQRGPTVRIFANKDRLGMGRVVEVTAELRDTHSGPSKGWMALPYLNGKRWGAHEFADGKGRAVFQLPLPNPGLQEILVEILPAPRGESNRWIWARDVRDRQTIYLQREFQMQGTPQKAEIWLAADDAANAFLNGQAICHRGGWMNVGPQAIPLDRLKQGANLLSIDAHNGVGPAGLLCRVDIQTSSGTTSVLTTPEWPVWLEKPANWPERIAPPGTAAKDMGTLESAQWSAALGQWPGMIPRRRLITGTLLPEAALISNTLQVRVGRRKLQPIKSDPAHLVGMQWEPWFTPLNAWWQTAPAVPVMGFYSSVDPDVTRQHMIWMIESGVDFLVVDWTNHLWDKQRWDERPDAANEIVHATTLAFETLARLRDEGHPVPRMVLYPGLNNGPATTMRAVNEELEWIHHNYVRNPRFKGLFVEYLGKPLVLIHNGGGPRSPDEERAQPLDTRFFTVRWQSSQLQLSRHHERGLWSWMDGSLEPMLTRRQGEPEALTVSTAFFGPGGWLGRDAFGRRGGWTYVESFKAALKYRPRFIQLHQFQEFAGQPEEQGYGPKHDVYVDSYNVEFSDDIEPVSMTAPAYRGQGGWGFLFLNLTRALVDLYRQQTPQTTVVAASNPAWHEVIRDDSVALTWTWAGKAPGSFTASINGKVLARGLQGLAARVSLGDTPDGPAMLRLTAEGTAASYVLSHVEDSLPAGNLEPAYVEMPIMVMRKK